MKFRNLAAAAAALTLSAAPVVAHAAPARAAAPVEEASDARGGSWLLALIAAILIALGIYFAVKDNNDPVSP
jgi:hypothetical protein